METTEVQRRRLAAGSHRFELGDRPLIMGILNATPDSFSDGGVDADLEARVGRARQLLEDGADLIDVGGESGVTDRPPVEPAEEIERVVPLIERLTAELGAVVSVDTYKPGVAGAAIAAGASMVNDPSGLINSEVAEICAQTGAALVVTHTRARPKQKLQDPRYSDVTEDAKRFLRARLEKALALGVREEQLLVCPGPDLGKEPAQTIELLRRLDALHDLGRPILLAVSRKDFVGALLSCPPRQRLAGTLAAVAHGVRRGAHVLRLHDVAEARDFLTVFAALEDGAELPRELRLANELRREPVGGQEPGAGTAKEKTP